MLKYISRFILFLLISNLCAGYASESVQTFTKKQFQQSKIQSRKTYLPPQSALVIEYSKTGCTVLYQQNADAIRHPASLTKIMTVYLLLEAIQSGRIKPNTLFRVSKLASMQMPSKLNLKPGNYIRAIDCVKALLVKSANDVAVVVAEGLSGSVSEFCRQMNNKAKSLGMESTHFENPSGVPNPKQVTSARDIFKLGLNLYKKFPQYWKYFALKSFSYNNYQHPTHCKILNWYKGADGAKTGFINSSGFNLWVTAQRYKSNGTPMRLFVVIFGGTSGKLRDFKAASLMDKYFKYCLTGKPTTVQAQPVKKPTVKVIAHSHQPLIDKSIFQTPEDVLVELDAVPIEDVVKSSGKTTEYFAELYKEDDNKVLQILDTNTLNCNRHNTEPHKKQNTKNTHRLKTTQNNRKQIHKAINDRVINNKNVKSKSRFTKRQINNKHHKIKSHTVLPVHKKRMQSVGQLLENIM